MPVISTTLCYPSAALPAQGVFVQRRVREIHRLMPVAVVAPVPWFPGFAGGASGGGCEAPESPPVWRPRMFYLPGTLKALDGRLYGWALRRGLSRVAEGGAPTLMDAHFVWPDGVGAWRVARRLGVPFVCTIRGKLVSQIAEQSKRRQIREMLLSADGLIAVSRSLADLADDVAGRRLGVRVIPNGVDRGVFHRFGGDSAANGPSVEARRRCGWSEHERVVVSVGHLQALKGFHRLVEIWPEVRRRVGNVRLVLVGGEAGEPEYARRLRDQIEATGLGSTSGAAAVSLPGRVEPAEVAAMLNAADLFVLASRSEGWCNAIVESLACGCPVVATDVGGNREIINDAGLGRLVPFGDPEALCEAVCGALGAGWDRRRIAEIGGRRDWQQVARECVDVFQSVLGRVARDPDAQRGKRSRP